MWCAVVGRRGLPLHRSGQEAHTGEAREQGVPVGDYKEGMTAGKFDEFNPRKGKIPKAESRPHAELLRMPGKGGKK